MSNWSAKEAVKRFLGMRENKNNLSRIDAALTQQDIDRVGKQDRQFTRGTDTQSQDRVRIETVAD